MERRRRRRKNLDEEVEMTTVVVAADRGVVPGDELAVYFSGDRNVLTNREAKDVRGPGQLEAVT